MNLYEVTNGYYGESYIRCLVVADTKERALELAKEKSDKTIDWNTLNIELILSDLTKEHIGSFNDCNGY